MKDETAVKEKSFPAFGLSIIAVCIFALLFLSSGESSSTPSKTPKATYKSSAAYYVTPKAEPTSKPTAKPTVQPASVSYSFAKQKTPGYTCFSEIGYNSWEEVVFVRFRDSGASYIYFDVSQDEWDKFTSASSLGSYYNKNIKAGIIANVFTTDYKRQGFSCLFYAYLIFTVEFHGKLGYNKGEKARGCFG